jgi:hypothetical protein
VGLVVGASVGYGEGWVVGWTVGEWLGWMVGEGVGVCGTGGTGRAAGGGKHDRSDATTPTVLDVGCYRVNTHPSPCCGGNVCDVPSGWLTSVGEAVTKSMTYLHYSLPVALRRWGRRLGKRRGSLWGSSWEPRWAARWGYW